MDDLCYKSISELRRLLIKGETSSAEITRAYLDRIDRLNAEINCYISVDSDQALRQAEQADNEIAQGLDSRPMLGIPVAIKDIFERENKAATAGSKSFTFTSKQTATVVDRLENSGAIILGTLNLDEFAAGGTGVNADFGRCINPWNRDHVTGGSSSGSAAAVGARLSAATLGSDAGGSIRLPAAFCGVTGLKPTYGRVSRFGVIPRTWSMDCIGPLARSAEDCAAVLKVIAGKDKKDPTSADAKFDFQAIPSHNTDSIRIGVDHSLHSELCGATKQSIDSTIQLLTDLGFRVEPVKLPDIDQLNDLHQVIVKCEAATFHGKRMRNAPQTLSIETKSVIQEGFLIPATRYIEALSLRSKILNEFIQQVFQQCDAVLLPMSGTTAPRYSTGDENNAHSIAMNFTQVSRFIRFANYLGVPAVSFPSGFDNNYLPIGLQLLGKPWNESLLLNIVDQFQKHSDFHIRELPAFSA